MRRRVIKKDPRLTGLSWGTGIRTWVNGVGVVVYRWTIPKNFGRLARNTKTINASVLGSATCLAAADASALHLAHLA
jgi:hypothetical protein